MFRVYIEVSKCFARLKVNGLTLERAKHFQASEYV